MTVTIAGPGTGGTGTSGTTVSVTRPAETQPGDILTVHITAGGLGITPVADGWTARSTGAYASASRDSGVWTRPATSGDPSSWAFTVPNAHRTWACVAVRGARIADPVWDAAERTDFGTPMISPNRTIPPGGLRLTIVAATPSTTGAATWSVTASPAYAQLSSLSTTGAGNITAGMNSYTNTSADYVSGSTQALVSPGVTAGLVHAIAFNAEPVAPVAGGRLAVIVEIAFGADPDADPDTWVWTDVSADLRDSPPIRIRGGRVDRAPNGLPPSARATLTLDNDRDQYTPGDPYGENWPHVRRNTPIRISVPYGYAPPMSRGLLWIESFTPRWGPDAASTDRCVDIVAVGRLGREIAGDEFGSALRRRVLASDPSDYWPAEDASGTRAANAVVGGPPLGAADGVRFRGDSTLVASLPLPTIEGGGQLSGSASVGVSTGAWLVAWAAKIPEAPAGSRQMTEWHTTADATRRWAAWIEPGSPPTWRVYAFDRAGTQKLNISANVVETGGQFYGQWRIYAIQVRENGANLDVEMRMYVPQLATGQSGTVTSSASGRPAAFSIIATVDNTAVGHIGFWTDPAMDTTEFGSQVAWAALDAETGELPDDRFARLLGEEGIPFVVRHSTRPQTEIPMGPQPAAGGLREQLADVQAVDRGTVHDLSSSGRVVFDTRASRYNLPPSLSLGLRQVSGGVRPTFSTAGVRTDVIVTRSGGNSERVTRAADEGRYPHAEEVNVQQDRHVRAIAGWIGHVGAAPELRYESLTLANLRRASMTPIVAHWLVTQIGDRVETLPGAVAGPPVDAIIEGYAETLSRETWSVDLVLSPAAPYAAAMLESGDSVTLRLGKAPEASRLTLAVDATQTSIGVTVDGAPWSDDAAPFDVSLDGEPVTVTAVAGSGPSQTLTVVRGINGRSRAHAADRPVTLWRPSTLGL